MRALLDVVLLILDLYWWVIVISALLSWMLALGVVNAYSPFIRSIERVLDVLSEPVLRPLRRLAPPINGLDISPILVLILIFFLQRIIHYNLYPLVIGY